METVNLGTATAVMIPHRVVHAEDGTKIHQFGNNKTK